MTSSFWNGDPASRLIDELNIDRGIVLQHKATTTAIHFLDLNIRVQDDKLITSTFFKDTDRNGYIGTDSWLIGPGSNRFLRASSLD